MVGVNYCGFLKIIKWEDVQVSEIQKSYLQIVNTVILFHRPNFQRHIVRARGQQLALRIPFYGVHFILEKQHRKLAHHLQ